METAVLALLAGKAISFARGEMSAIRKSPLAGEVRIGFLGIDGDEQADPRYHGGRDKAIHHYPSDHFAHWSDFLSLPLSALSPGAFSGNIATLGWLENDVCIGDRFRLGSALVEISQGRQPCWIQGERFGSAKLPAAMVKELRSGWYYRVIEEGRAEAGMPLRLVDRPLPDWSVARVFGLIVAGDHKGDRAALRILARLDVLHVGWRERARALLD